MYNVCMLGKRKVCKSCLVRPDAEVLPLAWHATAGPRPASLVLHCSSVSEATALLGNASSSLCAAVRLHSKACLKHSLAMQDCTTFYSVCAKHGLFLLCTAAICVICALYGPFPWEHLPSQQKQVDLLAHRSHMRHHVVCDMYVHASFIQ